MNVPLLGFPDQPRRRFRCVGLDRIDFDERRVFFGGNLSDNADPLAKRAGGDGALSQKSGQGGPVGFGRKVFQTQPDPRNNRDMGFDDPPLFSGDFGEGGPELRLMLVTERGQNAQVGRTDVRRVDSPPQSRLQNDEINAFHFEKEERGGNRQLETAERGFAGLFLFELVQALLNFQKRPRQAAGRARFSAEREPLFVTEQVGRSKKTGPVPPAPETLFEKERRRSFSLRSRDMDGRRAVRGPQKRRKPFETVKIPPHLAVGDRNHPFVIGPVFQKTEGPCVFRFVILLCHSLPCRPVSRSRAFRFL